MAITFRTLQTAGRDAWANRGSFVLQVGIMVANNIVWVVFWSLFFSRVGTVRGWALPDVLLLFSIVCTAAGVAFGVLANCRQLGQLVAQGRLDEVLVLPVSPLRYLLTSRINASNIGDAVFGAGLFLIACNPTPERIVLFLIGTACSAVVLTSFIVLAGCLSFFTTGSGRQADSAFNAIVLFASYPIDFFNGAIKVILYTVVPAAFVTGAPVELIRHFDLRLLLGYLAVTAAVAAATSATFKLGLRRYSSGSIWT